MTFCSNLTESLYYHVQYKPQPFNADSPTSNSLAETVHLHIQTGDKCLLHTGISRLLTSPQKHTMKDISVDDIRITSGTQMSTSCLVGPL